MVHRKNKEIANNCSSQPAGQTRDQQRANANSRLSTQRAEERAEQAASARDADPMNQQYKRIKLTQEYLSVISSQNAAIGSQLKMYSDHRESYVKTMGEEEYDKKIANLLGQLPNPDVSNLFAADGPNSPHGSAGSSE
jgi:hypothetical protein